MHTTVLLITANRVMISNSITNLKEAYLRIIINPTETGRNIECLTVQYYNPACTPSRLHEQIADANLFQSITYSMVGEGEAFVERARPYMQALPHDEISTIIKEYTNYIEDGMIIDGFVGGIAAYLGFILLVENNIFATQMPFQFSMPVTIFSGNCLNRNMLQYLSLPLIALAKTTDGILLQLVTFIQSFINMWEPAFTPGPTISPINETRMCMEIMSGFTHHTIQLMQATQNQNREITDLVATLEHRLQSAVSQMKREIHNLRFETRTALQELTSSCQTSCDKDCSSGEKSNSSSGSVVHRTDISSEGSVVYLKGEPSDKSSGSVVYLEGEPSDRSSGSVVHRTDISSEGSVVYLDGESSNISSGSVVHRTDVSSEGSIVYLDGESSFQRSEPECDDRLRHIIRMIVREETQDIVTRLDNLEQEVAMIWDKIDTCGSTNICTRPCPGVITIRQIDHAAETMPGLVGRSNNRRRTEGIEGQIQE